MRHAQARKESTCTPIAELKYLRLLGPFVDCTITVLQLNYSKCTIVGLASFIRELTECETMKFISMCIIYYTSTTYLGEIQF